MKEVILEDKLTTDKSRADKAPGAAFDRKRIALLNRFGPLLALFLVYGFFAMLNPKIVTPTAIETIVQQTVIVGVASIGMTFVIISGGIDLSAGSIIAMGSVAVAFLMRDWGLGSLPAAVGGVFAGLVLGLINGTLITRLKVVPFIVTLGTLLVVRGVAKGLAHSMPINVPQTWLSGLLAALPPELKWMLIPAGAWLMIGLALLAAGFLRYTRLGHHVFAVGSNEQTARLCGVAVERVKVFVYATSGAFSGMGGLMLMSYQEQGDPTGAVGMELDVIAAVVIGGGSLSGGQGSILGSLVGAIIMTVIRTGCQLNGWPTWVTQVVTGIVIVIAVAVDRLRHRNLGL
ncbi:MAG: hypothetical protein CMM76_17335 [Rhodospirillaceae bacterium]|jgi:ribose transport system permease protein|nr:hypothetical protein [Rhodospirillaceae bacterium]|tara:strand:+ start:5594 stop:6628 length:1035 start_codon:yes stop_codon:yes gene_type:complete